MSFRCEQSRDHARLQTLRSAIAAAGLLFVLAWPAFPADPPTLRNVLLLMAGEYGLPDYDLILHEIRRVVKGKYPSPTNRYADCFVVDDDASVRRSPSFLIQSLG